ncbi:uncharacterized protein LOC106660518 [Trichogramma pretiosum]|uniref:uncharacterized protein LOC106660518 n=1 Tax=Trichogramma pretiosum TaxID=7493 RepID=UPI0006C99351|nr:uncharacterized protein LOC106660518 [Trichogramma pretiosum]
MNPEEAFSVYRSFLWFLGVWPLEEKSRYQRLRYYTAAFFQASFLLHTSIEICLNRSGVSDMVDVCLFFASAFLALIKHTYLHLHGRKIAYNLRSYMRDWRQPSEYGSAVMRSHFKMYRYQFIIYNSIGYIGTTLFLIRTLLLNYLKDRGQARDDGPEFEYEFICKISFLSKPFLLRYHTGLLVLQYLQCMYVCSSGASTDCFFFGLLLHLAAQFKILNRRWHDFGDASRDDQASFDELVARHQLLTKLGQHLEQSFSRVVLLQLLISVILICMSGCSILVSMMERDYVTMLISTNCVSFMITESFIYGYASDYLKSQSLALVDAVAACGWYDLERARRRDLAFVLMRALLPCSITAGKFFYVTHNTIVQLVKTSVSYLSVLRMTIEHSRKADAN